MGWEALTQDVNEIARHGCVPLYPHLHTHRGQAPARLWHPLPYMHLIRKHCDLPKALIQKPLSVRDVLAPTRPSTLAVRSLSRAVSTRRIQGHDLQAAPTVWGQRSFTA